MAYIRIGKKDSVKQHTKYLVYKYNLFKLFLFLWALQTIVTIYMAVNNG